MSSINYKLAILPGDGIGPEVMDSALNVLNIVSKKFDISFQFKTYLVGGHL